MAPMLLDGNRIAAEILQDVRIEAAGIQERYGVVPTLATVLVGDDPASQVYVKKKVKTCQELGMESRHLQFPRDAGRLRVEDAIRDLNADPSVNGILLQLPLPPGLDADNLLEMIHPAKDVDGFHPFNMGRLMLGRPTFVSCTPAGIMELLVRSGVDIAGKTAVVVGRSNIVGKPVAALLLQRHATVVVCHSRTRDRPAVCRQADILIAAIGKPGLLTADYVREGAVVVDVGINSVTDAGELRRIVGDSPDHWAAFAKRGRALVGDVEWRPGGVGPLTLAMLMRSTVQACHWQQEGVSWR
jgi:methylenetetrahydrofolate dehydrogenase (NADP+)/methenyltetrahydrofolate cyclohydrolase